MRCFATSLNIGGYQIHMCKPTRGRCCTAVGDRSVVFYISRDCPNFDILANQITGWARQKHTTLPRWCAEAPQQFRTTAGTPENAPTSYARTHETRARFSLGSRLLGFCDKTDRYSQSNFLVDGSTNSCARDSQRKDVFA